MGVMRRIKKVSSFELYKFNPLLPHYGSIARELVHCYTWGRLRIVTFFYFIKSETSDSFVNHFDGHFAYLKTLDFYFNAKRHWVYFQSSFSFFVTMYVTMYVPTDHRGNDSMLSTFSDFRGQWHTVASLPRDIEYTFSLLSVSSWQCKWQCISQTIIEELSDSTLSTFCDFSDKDVR